MENLVVVILNDSGPRFTHEVFRLVAYSGCCVVDARVNIVNKHIAMTLLIGGAWNTIAKFESVIKKYSGQVLLSRIPSRTEQAEVFPYSSYIVALNKPDVLAKITEFLTDQEVILYSLYVESYQAPITKASMLGVSLSFGFHSQPSEGCLVADFREHFIVFCDEHNFDVAMEPQRN